MGQIEHEAMEREREQRIELEQARRAIRELEQKLEQLEAKLEAERQLRTQAERKLGSGQCVDLAKIGEHDLGFDLDIVLYQDGLRTTEETGRRLKEWLVSIAGIKS